MPQGIRTLDLPLEGGLDQKTDALWLQPGSAAAATNLVHKKHGSIQKRQGLQALSSLGNYINTTGFGLATQAMTLGRRLASYRGQLAAIARGLWSDALWIYQDTFGTAGFNLADLVPEAYLYPYEIVGAPIASVYEMDCAVVNGLEVIAWATTTNFDGTAGCAIFTEIRDAAQGTLLQRACTMATSATPAALGIPKLLAAGNFVILTWSDAAASNIQGMVINTTVLAAGWQGAFVINQTSGDSINNISASTCNPYDVAVVIGDATKFGLLYERNNAGTRTIVLRLLNVNNILSAISSTPVSGSDSQWTTDNGVSAANAQLTSLALRIDSGLSRASFAYGWRTSTTTRATFGSFTYPGLVAVANSVNLYGTPGPTSAANDKAPSIMGLEYSTATSNHVVRLSPGGAALDQGAAQLPYIASWQVTVGASTIAIAAHQPRVTFGASLWSRDLPLNGISYCIGYVPSSTQGSFFLLADDAWQDTTTLGVGSTPGDYFPMRLVGTIAPRLSSALVPTVAAPLQSRVATHMVANAYAPGVQTYQATVPVELNVVTTAPALLRIDMQSPLAGQACELGANLCLAGGCPSAFDGTTCFELGYPYYPAITSISMAGGGGNLSAGSYDYIAVFWIEDARGQTHLSARSVPFTVTAVANDKATVHVSTMGFSAKTKKAGIGAEVLLGTGPQSFLTTRPTVQVKLYRTQSGGTIYTNVLAGDAPAAVNSQFAATVSIVDSAADASIASNALLYGDGSDGTAPGDLLDNNCPPAFQWMIVHNNRLFGGDGPRVWCSREFTTGEGSAFHEETAFSVDDGPGDVIAGASMDGNLILFKRDRLFYVTGLGPADNGQDNDFSQPQRIASDVGCIDWRSVVSTPQGVFFQSPAGRRLLTRDFQVVPVPAVEDIDSASPVVTSAVIHPTSGRVIFTENTDDTSSPRSGTVLADDYVIGAWTQGNVSDNAGHPTLGFVSAAVAQAVTVAGPPVTLTPTYHVLRDNGTVLRESPSSNLDVPASGGASVFVPATWTSPWLRSDGLQGWSWWSEVRIAFQSLDPAQITVSIAYDGNSSPTDVFTFTAAQVATMGSLAILALQPTNQRAATMQITIADSANGSPVTGAGFRLQNVRVDYGYEPGGYRAPVAQQG